MAGPFCTTLSAQPCRHVPALAPFSPGCTALAFFRRASEGSPNDIFLILNLQASAFEALQLKNTAATRKMALKVDLPIPIINRGCRNSALTTRNAVRQIKGCEQRLSARPATQLPKQGRHSPQVSTKPAQNQECCPTQGSSIKEREKAGETKTHLSSVWISMLAAGPDEHL